MNSITSNPFDSILSVFLSEIRAEIRAEIEDLKLQKAPATHTDSMTSVQALEYLKDIGLPMKLGQFYKLTANGALPSQRIGKRLILSRKELDQWVESKKYRRIMPKERMSKLLAASANKRLERADR